MINHGCLATHEADPASVPRGCRSHKRARHVADEEAHPVGGECEEEEEEEEDARSAESPRSARREREESA